MIRRKGGVAAVCALLLAACGEFGAGGSLAIALNWKPEPEFGGMYAALELGLFERAGIEVEFTGGPGAPVVPMIVAGRVPFGIVSADEVIIARSRGDDLVAIFATYQTSPLGIMVHAERGADSLAEVFAQGGTLAVEPGVPYVEFLEREFDLSAMKIIPYGYSIAPFLSDDESAMQCFVTSEPIEARRQGSNPRVFLVADAGYEPYEAVVATRGQFVRDNPREVAALVEALRAGWRHYLDQPAATNAVMHELNPAMDQETFDLAAAAQHELIENDHTRTHGLGAMSVERWRELVVQLLELGIIERAVEGESCFVDL